MLNHIFCIFLILRTSPTYNPAVPNVKEDTQIQLNIEFYIKSILEVDFAKHQFTSLLQVKIIWEEPGVSFLNLRNSSDNMLTQDQIKMIWHPELRFVNTLPMSSTRSLSSDCISIQVFRVSEPEPDESTNLYKDLVYDGAKNTLEKSMDSLTQFYCKLTDNYYPFSLHFCIMKMEVDTLKPEFVNIQSANLSLLNSNYRNFYIYNESIKIVNGPGIDKLLVIFYMKMQLDNVVTTAYLPMSILNAICQLSIYLNLNRMFETILAVNATILVAISSFITSEIANLPKSDSMKPHEFWMLTMFFHPFLLIIAQVIKLFFNCDM